MLHCYVNLLVILGIAVVQRFAARYITKEKIIFPFLFRQVITVIFHFHDSFIGVIDTLF